MSRIFVERPIFAWVIAIIVMMSGMAALRFLPVAQYPDVAPPQVTVRASYPGASAETLQNSVTQIIEQSLTGIDGLLYFSSSSTQGQASITVVFESGTDPDIAQVQVQNQVQQSVSRLPTAVQQQGLTVRKASPDNLLVVGVYDATDVLSNLDVADYLTSTLQDALGRVEGVGDTNVFGSQYAMRVWLDPIRMASFQLMPGDVIAAIRDQNAEVAAGQIGGQPQPDTQMLNATVTAQSRLRTPEQFRAILLKSQANGAMVRLADVARVELGAENAGAITRINGHPGAGLAIMLAPGANALDTSDRVKAEVERLALNFPPGLTHTYSSDSTAFIRLSIEEVVKTLIEAIVLVVIVMFIFLQNWRATLVPAIAVPVVLLGTFTVLWAAGFSVNTMTLFALVLAIGLLVDDAIVVVENVERLLHENPDMSPKEATIRSMREIGTALVAIALVLSAVFLPMALFGGSTGVIYRQFSVTIVSAMVLSVLVALVLSPALTATLLKQHHRDAPKADGWLQRRFPAVSRLLDASTHWFNDGFTRLAGKYQDVVRLSVRRKGVFLLLYAGLTLALAVLFLRLPTGFLPQEDQGQAMIQYRLPAGATLGRTMQVQRRIETYLGQAEPGNVATLFTVSGGGTRGQNSGQGFIALTPWAERPGSQNTADAIVQRATASLSGIPDAQVFAMVPAAIRGLGQSGGFSMQLQNTGGLSQEAFEAARDRLLDAARKDTALSSVRLAELPDVSALRVDFDSERLAALGLSRSDVNTTLSAAWGGSYVNDFDDRGRVKRVYVQGDAPYRAAPSDLSQWQVRGSDGQMTPFSAFASTSWAMEPTALSRFNGFSSYEFQGTAAAGYSSGEAMARLQALAVDIPGVGVAWSGLSFQERLSSGQAPLLYALSLLVVFLCLAALYESWSVPLAVLLVVPLGLVGAVLAVTLRDLVNDVYLQIGLLTTMGLAAKNAILIVEFAEQAERNGQDIMESALEAARLRLRPILMTSFAFIFGVLPLALSTGPGANSRIAIGTAVIGGTLTATILAIFYIPLFFILIRKSVRSGLGWSWLGGKPAKVMP